jgi:class 3 adenylate cyclase
MSPIQEKSLKITTEEIAHIDRFRKLKDTSVLTIMFTDIKGFTQMTEEKGEAYSTQIREHHDQILTQAIEENEGGMVVKHIGDAIMAVFSEPSSAVARALKIQKDLDTFNANNPELVDIVVRIGLDMGQVAVENEVSPDMFGRHVNRASRVEGLADGGQIYLTYPVFDSAKGWLSAQTTSTAKWKQHGQYFLKGIPAPVDIYEVHTDQQTPRAPRKGKKKNALPTWTVGAGLVVLGAALTLGVMQFQKTSVWFVKMYGENVMLDGKTEVVLDGSREVEARKALIKISKGRHVLHYDINYRVKYFAEIDVKRGKNHIRAKFKECGLPSIGRHFSLNKGNSFQNEKKAERSYDYMFYDKQGKKQEHKADLSIVVKGARDPENAEQLRFVLSWKIILDEQVISEDEKIILQDPKKKERQDGTFILYKDDTHYYYAKFYILRTSANLDIDGAFIEYLKE